MNNCRMLLKILMLSSVVFPLLVYSQSPSPLIAPTSVDFGTIISSPSPSQTIILIYAHPPINAPLTINSIQVSSPFKEVTSSCSGCWTSAPRTPNSFSEECWDSQQWSSPRLYSAGFASNPCLGSSRKPITFS